MHRILIVLVALIGLVESGRHANAGNAQWDVLGMRLGASVEEIEAAAAAESLTEKGRSKAPSFEQAVKIRAGQRIEGFAYTSVKKLRFASDTQKVEVDFVATPEGARAYMIDYINADTSISSDVMTARVEAKYGAPDERGARGWVWGDTAPMPLRVKPNLEYAIRPQTMEFGNDAVGSLTLRDPQLLKEAQSRR